MGGHSRLSDSVGAKIRRAGRMDGEARCGEADQGGEPSLHASEQGSDGMKSFALGRVLPAGL